ncbi:hypothetical protein EZL74_06780 [Flavobacterium silvisoli]|uniref:Auto-transporter adhesin head GIN domain-containing protein n=1 Tax=Flavobacterium silvisoli TaxID=2529433 RepID=A0A4Q9Z051_9FLAO|nr:hypothetical protein [Flavobacterium silvisoli]TBX69575.1 hypothetical protein EZL74_06780 [Flavobacterium silvisoli]
MKKLFLFLILGALTLSCSSDSSSGSSISNTPEAKSQYDNSNFGIYKGVFVGSSGTVNINVNNDGSIVAILVIDGTTFTYTTTESVTLNSVINGLTFTNGSSSFDFNVDASGNSATITNIVISGHPNANMYVVKEFSDALVKCYTGSFSGDDSGVFNLIVSEGEINGLAKSNSGNESIILQGMETNNVITGSFSDGTFSGNVSGNTISGTWQNISSESGNWSGTRKL